MDEVWISGGFTVLAAVLGFGPVAWQIWSQGEQNRADARLARRQAFNEELYKDGVLAARRLANSASSFATAFAVLEVQLKIAVDEHKRTGIVRPPDKRYPEFLELNKRFQEDLVDLVFLIEERLIAEPKLEVFRRAFLARGHDVRVRFDVEMQNLLLPSMQHVLADGTYIPYSVPSSETVARLEKKFFEINDPLYDLTSFANDLILELQNLHLGDVFGERNDHRVPLDPRKTVLRIDRHEEIAKWLEETPWEAENRKVEARVRAGLPQSSIADSGVNGGT